MKILRCLFAIFICSLKIWLINCNCQIVDNLSGTISSLSDYDCWIITVPDNYYLRKLNGYISGRCENSLLNITCSNTGEYWTFYGSPRTINNLVAFAELEVHYTSCSINRWIGSSSIFELNFHKESLACVKTGHFRCSNHTCIHSHQLCDGKSDCEDESDEENCETEITAINEINKALEHSLLWLKSQRDSSFSWGGYTHRAVVALYLSGNVSFRSSGMEQELIYKELVIQVLSALLRNNTDPLTVNELSTLINALAVTCHNTRRFFGNNLLKVLYDRLSLKSANPGPYLTLCNSNWILPIKATENLLHMLQMESDFAVSTDLKALTIMALTCIKNRTSHFMEIGNSTELYESAIGNFIDNQNPDGSFGGPQTTALVTQALIASGQEKNENWKFNAAVSYLTKQLTFSSNFILAYLTIPIFNRRSLVDLGNVNCSGSYREQRQEIDIRHEIQGKLKIQYSLYTGDKRNNVHTIHLHVPEGSSAYYVMRVANLTDPTYRFSSTDVSGYQYIYEVSGIPNDPEARMYWMLYKKSLISNETIHVDESPDRISLQDGDHLILWYKTSDIE